MARNGRSYRSSNKTVSRASAAFFWLFPAALGLFVMGSIVHERVLAMSWEFAEYGSIARNVDRGMGPFPTRSNRMISSRSRTRCRDRDRRSFYTTAHSCRFG